MTDTGLGHISATAERSDSVIEEQKRHEFSIGLYRQLCSQTNNVIFSPYSIRRLLALLCEGSDGETRDELIALLGSCDPSGQIVTAQSSSTQLNIATGLWADRDFPIKEAFFETARDFYGAQTESLDFADPQSVIHINDWISANTAGKVQDILRKLGKGNRLVGANAIYFKGQWKSPFKESLTTERPFNISSTESLPVPTMMRLETQGYFEDSNIQAIKLDYLGSTLSMIVILPRQVDGLDTFTRSLNSDSFSTIVKRMDDVLVRLCIPRFKVQAQYNLIRNLEELGLRKLFDPVHANLTGVSENRLFVSAMIHEAVAEVNEVGTEAAAVTLMTYFGSMQSTSRKPTYVDMFVDHPFFVAIHDKSTDSILFMGSVFDPTV
jgi:serine protease inhibitor